MTDREVETYQIWSQNADGSYVACSTLSDTPRDTVHGNDGALHAPGDEVKGVKVDRNDQKVHLLDKRVRYAPLKPGIVPCWGQIGFDSTRTACHPTATGPTLFQIDSSWVQQNADALFPPTVTMPSSISLPAPSFTAPTLAAPFVIDQGLLYALGGFPPPSDALSQFMCIDSADGTPRWANLATSAVENLSRMVSAHAGYAYVYSSQGPFGSLDFYAPGKMPGGGGQFSCVRADGVPVWSVYDAGAYSTVMQGIVPALNASPAFDDSRQCLYVRGQSYSNTVSCLSMVDGSQIWQVNALASFPTLSPYGYPIPPGMADSGTSIVHPLLFAGDVIWIPVVDGNRNYIMVGMSPVDGSILFKTQVCSAQTAEFESNIRWMKDRAVLIYWDNSSQKPHFVTFSTSGEIIANVVLSNIGPGIISQGMAAVSSETTLQPPWMCFPVETNPGGPIVVGIDIDGGVLFSASSPHLGQVVFAGTTAFVVTGGNPFYISSWTSSGIQQDWTELEGPGFNLDSSWEGAQLVLDPTGLYFPGMDNMIHRFI